MFSCLVSTATKLKRFSSGGTGQNLKNDRDFVVLRFCPRICHRHKMSVIWPNVNILRSSFFPNFFYFYVPIHFCKQKLGIIGSHWGSFLGGPLFKGVLGGAPLFFEFLFHRKLKNWQILKVKKFSRQSDHPNLAQ